MFLEVRVTFALKELILDITGAEREWANALKMKIALPRIAEALPGNTIEIDGGLFRAAQMTVIIDDVASALAVIIQLGAAPLAAIGLATGFQIIAVDADFLAALRI